MTALAPLPSTACRAHWVLYPFWGGGAAVDGTGAVAVSCKRALSFYTQFRLQKVSIDLDEDTAH